MKVLVVGNGGREHALCTFIHKSPICSKLFCIPGSDSIQQIAECFKIDPMNNIQILNFRSYYIYLFKKNNSKYKPTNCIF